MPQIKLDRLKKIIQEELALVKEGDNHADGAKLMTSAAKLLDAIEKFKKDASKKALADVENDLGALEGKLKRITDSPMMYVDSATSGQYKKVSLKPANSATL